MIGWITDNPLSRTVMESIPGIEIRHIKDIKHYIDDESFFMQKNIFYGILRGNAIAMRMLEYLEDDYYYIDNGYFDALYVDKSMHKSMEGKFRVVKNGMHEVYPARALTKHDYVRNILVVPPSPYSANFYDTTPEDWRVAVGIKLQECGYSIRVRDKVSTIPLEEDIAWCNGVVAFNSMVVLNAVKSYKMAIDTHGIFRNLEQLKEHPVYNLEKLKTFYEPKQFTLQEFKEGKCKFT